MFFHTSDYYTIRTPLQIGPADPAACGYVSVCSLARPATAEYLLYSDSEAFRRYPDSDKSFGSEIRLGPPAAEVP
ncbi:hypothetical protein EVAR_61794_1 [Eumeta japonica]|uniref:Uncharacterized protein n=1 Tax=Eumeta variegata TaxID=151549 RepID=A0A4C1Z289_EUMVA|nr:hypothetical protein EVAR_61794_1 [Eumeta japonica]